MSANMFLPPTSYPQPAPSPSGYDLSSYPYSQPQPSPSPASASASASASGIGAQQHLSISSGYPPLNTNSLEYFSGSAYHQPTDGSTFLSSSPSYSSQSLSGPISSTHRANISSTPNSSHSFGGSGASFDGEEDEPPLLEELGIDIKDIFKKTFNVSLPFRPIPTNMLAEADTDLAGPLVLCLLLGLFLLANGKVHFGYIYGFGLVGCLAMYLILNLMSREAISVDRTMTVLGYSLLPIVVLALLNLAIDLRSSGGLATSGAFVCWCTWNATRCFEKALDMREQRWLVAYPVALLYACFALLTIF